MSYFLAKFARPGALSPGPSDSEVEGEALWDQGACSPDFRLGVRMLGLDWKLVGFRLQGFCACELERWKKQFSITAKLQKENLKP